MDHIRNITNDQRCERHPATGADLSADFQVLSEKGFVHHLMPIVLLGLWSRMTKLMGSEQYMIDWYGLVCNNTADIAQELEILGRLWY